MDRCAPERADAVLQRTVRPPQDSKLFRTLEGLADGAGWSRGKVPGANYVGPPEEPQVLKTGQNISIGRADEAGNEIPLTSLRRLFDGNRDRTIWLLSTPDWRFGASRV